MHSAGQQLATLMPRLEELPERAEIGINELIVENE
jgi:hypothetical protein